MSSDLPPYDKALKWDVRFNSVLVALSNTFERVRLLVGNRFIEYEDAGAKKFYGSLLWFILTL